MKELDLVKNKRVVDERILRIKQIHIKLIAERVDISDIPPGSKIVSASKVMNERECERCGKVGTKELCDECQEFLRKTKVIVKPSMLSDNDLENVFKDTIIDLVKDTSIFVVFKLEDIILGNSEYKEPAELFIKNMVKCGWVEDLHGEYRLTPDGIQELNIS